MSEADTCRTYVVPKLYAAGWSDEQIREQVTLTDGRIVPTGASHARKPDKRADYILRYRPDLAVAVVEAKPDADPLDLLLHVAYNAPLLTRRERAQALQSKRANFFNAFTPAAREVLEVLLEKYADYGLKQLTNWGDVLKIPPLSDRYSVMEIAAIFGGAEKVKEAVEKMQTLLYSDYSN